LGCSPFLAAKVILSISQKSLTELATLPVHNPNCTHVGDVSEIFFFCSNMTITFDFEQQYNYLYSSFILFILPYDNSSDDKIQAASRFFHCTQEPHRVYHS
jgi:hypothetical protein